MRLVRKNKKAVYAVALSRLRNPHDAEDVMQDVFIDAYRKFDKLRNPGNVRTWLHKITVNRCNDHFRALLRREKREQAFVERQADNHSTDALGEAERNDVVREVVERLPEKSREVLMLKHFAGFSCAEISEMTGYSKSTITGRLQTARRRVRDKLIEMGEGVD